MGYAGQEHIDAFGIINMNGRVYDPQTAQFFSPDPFVQSAGDWLNYNRYSYVMNNPTRYTDPSGNVFEHDNDPKPLLNRLTPWVFRKITPRQYENSIPNAYFYLGNGQYCNFNGNLVPFDEVLHNYLIPGSTYISSDNNPFSVANDMKDGWRFFNFRALGKDNFMLSKGDLGSITSEPNGAIIFSNSTASVTTLSDWGFTDESNKSTQYQASDYLVYGASYVNDTRTQGFLIWYNSMHIETGRYSATSGSGNPKLYTLPAGLYVAHNYNLTTDPRFMRNGIGFTIQLDPKSVWDENKQTFRTDLLIHPARSNGTGGCIGLISNDYYNILDFQTRISNYLQTNKDINVFVKY